MPDYELVESVRFAEDETEFVCAATKRLYRCWLENRRDDGLLDAQSFILEDYPDLLRKAIVVDVLGECEDVRVRFLGSEMALRYSDATGMAMKETGASGLYLERTLKIYHAVFATGRVLVNGPRQMTLAGLEHLTVEGLYVPMTLGDGRVGRILMVNEFREEQV